jgi:hypothetical protein
VRKSIGVIPQALTSDLDLSADENLSDLRQALRHPGGENAALDPTSCWRRWIC